MSSLTIHLVDAYDPRFGLCPSDFQDHHVIWRRDLLDGPNPVFVAIGPDAPDEVIRRCLDQLMEIVVSWRHADDRELSDA